MKDLKYWLVKIKEKFSPEAVILYGSRAKGDFLETSDWEILILFKKNKRVKREMLRRFIKNPRIVPYPASIESFKKMKLDAPFPKAGFFRDLFLGGKVLTGKDLLKTVKPPAIKIIDLIEVIEFNLGYSLAAMLSWRDGNRKTARTVFTKSCLFASRCLVILKKKKFPLTYEKIVTEVKKLNLREFADLVPNVYEVRHGLNLNEKDIYRNITYLNQFLLPQFHDVLKKKGNVIVLK